MNKLILFILFFLPFIIYANLYEEALKLDAKGEYVESEATFRSYFNKNINQDNQDSVIAKLFYASTLLESSEKSLQFLIHYVKYMENSNSRYTVYKRIAEIYELKGSVINAGKYYEKAAYTVDGVIDYTMLLTSLEILTEIGFFKETIFKLGKINIDLLNKSESDRYYYIFSRVLLLNGNNDKSYQMANRIVEKDSRYWYLLYEIDGSSKSLDSDKGSLESILVESNIKKLRTPTDYIGIKSEIDYKTNISLKDDGLQEIFIGYYKTKKSASGVINLIEQMRSRWFFTEDDGLFALYLLTDDKNDSIKQLNKVGIKVGD